jgi:hypothetical protein
MKQVRFVSDYTSLEHPNILHLTQRDDGDIVLNVIVNKDNILLNKSVQFTASGSRLRKNYGKIINKFSEIIDLINEDLLN